jgi:hypothetical protein
LIECLVYGQTIHWHSYILFHWGSFFEEWWMSFSSPNRITLHWSKKTTVKFEGLKTWCLPLRKKDPFGCIPLNVTDLKHLMKWCIRRVVCHFSIFILRLVKQQLFKFIRKSNGESTIHDISVILKRWLHCLNDVKNRLDSDIITERVVLQSHPLFLRKFPKKR